MVDIRDSLNYSHYDAIGAAKYDVVRAMRPRAPEGMIELANLMEVQRTLDLACGTGQLSVALSARYRGEIIGVDRSIDMLRLAAEKHVYTLLAQGDVIALPFGSQIFDAVVGSYFLHHIPTNLRHLLAIECFRVLRQGAVVLMTTAPDDIRKNPLCRFFPEFASIDLGRFPRIETISSWLHAAGFREIVVTRIHEEPIVLNDAFADWIELKPISTLELIDEGKFRMGMQKLRHQVSTTRHCPETYSWTSTLVCGRKK